MRTVNTETRGYCPTGLMPNNIREQTETESSLNVEDESCDIHEPEIANTRTNMDGKDKETDRDA